MKQINIMKIDKRQLVNDKLVCFFSSDSKILGILRSDGGYGLYRTADATHLCEMNLQYF